MDKEIGKLYQLSDYRNKVTASGGNEEHPSFTFVFGDNAATGISESAERDSVTPEQLLSRALGLVIADSELRSEGYEGPLYRRPRRMSGAFRGWLARVGLVSPEQIKLRSPDDMSEIH